MSAEEHLRWLLEEIGEPMYNLKVEEDEDPHAFIASFTLPARRLNELRRSVGLPPVDEEVRR